MRHDLRQEPYAVTLHVRICAGGGQQWPSLPRLIGVATLCLHNRPLPSPPLPTSGVPKERPETFLLEVAVIGQDFCNGVATHRLHRNTIHQAVLLILALTVEFEAA